MYHILMCSNLLLCTGVFTYSASDITFHTVLIYVIVFAVSSFSSQLNWG